jgi:hypothetical protein
LGYAGEGKSKKEELRIMKKRRDTLTCRRGDRSSIAFDQVHRDLDLTYNSVPF